MNETHFDPSKLTEFVAEAIAYIIDTREKKNRPPFMATESCIRALNPDIIIYENVKGMVSKRNKPDFDEWCATLESLGYVVQWKILNAKDFGVAQNRERCFPIAIRKDLPMAGHYNYPQGFPLAKCVEDYMEPAEDIGEEYFISQDRVTDKILSDIIGQPNVRAEMEKLYHEEWEEANSL